MIRVSIDLPDDYKYRMQPVVANQDAFLNRDILVGFEIANPDLRILHQDTAVRELANSSSGRFRTPVIVYERVDAAVVLNSQPIREMMAHPDVKFWLKRNSFRDFNLNNRNFLTGRLHYMTLNGLAKLHKGDTEGEKIVVPLTAEIAGKIRPLPVAPIERFAAFREASIDWSAKRPIDVNFAGLVDYEVRGTDYWDGAYDTALAVRPTKHELVINEHRREAVRQLIEMAHLRVFIGTNRAVQSDIYLTAMLRSSIAVSPWGLGEYSYRDYEAILAGCVLVKPRSDHIVTFAPDIYQADKYYVACAPDFSDLHEVIRSIMSDRTRATVLARTAREDMLAANAPRRIVEYFSGLFWEALDKKGSPGMGEHLPAITSLRAPALGIHVHDLGIARGEIEMRNMETPALDVHRVLAFREDSTENISHDVRLMANDVVAAGVYRLRCLLRRTGRRHFALHVHKAWEDGYCFGVDCESGDVACLKEEGNAVRIVQSPSVVLGPDKWIAVSAFFQIDRMIVRDFFLVLYAAETNRNIYYDGKGEDCFDVALLDIDRVSGFEV